MTDFHDYASHDTYFPFGDYSETRFSTFYPTQAYLPPSGWPLSEDDQLELDMAAQKALNSTQHQPTAPSSHTFPVWQLQYQPLAQDAYSHRNYHTPSNSYDAANYNTPLHPSSLDFMPTSAAHVQEPIQVSSAALPNTQYMSVGGPMSSMTALAHPLSDYQSGLMAYTVPPPIGLNIQTTGLADMHPAFQDSPPSSASHDVCSSSCSDNSWNTVNHAYARQSLGSSLLNGDAVFNPGETLHIRTEGSSSPSSNASQHDPSSAGGYEEVPFPTYSPALDSSGFDFTNPASYDPSSNIVCKVEDPTHECDDPSTNDSVFSTPIPVKVRPVSMISLPTSSSSSPTATSPPSRRRKTLMGPAPPPAKTTKPLIKKNTSSAIVKSSAAADKRVGRRRGPLRPDQRQQAHEIRKLRACLRCKFLKKTCDKGDPCAGCRPSHARLWQVPCTRIDIKDIGFFLKDWKTDFERHVTPGFSISNIKGFADKERILYITHGYGHFLPIKAREVYVANQNCFQADWLETRSMKKYEANTTPLSAGIEGVSDMLSEYIDCHLDDGNFDKFIDQYFEGTPFLTEILHTAYRYYVRTETPVVRKALKLVLAYNLTLHVTLVEGLSEEESRVGRISDRTSRWNGKTLAPVMINFQVKTALADMWRELQKDILQELSTLYSAVYQGERLRKWPTIFMVATILLAVWELMQFDCHYREPDAAKVAKFCADMESTPVGVVVGLFQAISQKLPGFMEWDASKHSGLLSGDEPVSYTHLTLPTIYSV